MPYIAIWSVEEFRMLISEHQKERPSRNYPIDEHFKNATILVRQVDHIIEPECYHHMCPHLSFPMLVKDGFVCADVSDDRYTQEYVKKFSDNISVRPWDKGIYHVIN